MKQFVVYTRVSTRRQGDSGLGLAAQKRDIDLYLQTYAEIPWEIIGEFQDIESGANGERPELWEAIKLAEKTGAVLLVSKLDRVSRKVSFIANLMDRKKLNFTVASMPSADKFQLHIYAALAEQEREFISLRTKQALAPMKGTGKLGGNRGNIDKANAAARALADSTTYTFAMDYFWMMGDNRHNSADSRFWGFVPENHIVGKALFVWMSWDKNAKGLNKIRWNRLFSSVK